MRRAVHSADGRVRHMREFMMWNHAIFVAAALRSVYYGEYAFCLLGSVTTILSFFYHRTRETGCQPQESYLAKAVVAYILIASLIRFTLFQVLHVLVWEAASLAIFYSQDNYGKVWDLIHPWLHVTVGGACHVYISYHKQTIDGCNGWLNCGNESGKDIYAVNRLPTMCVAVVFLVSWAVAMTRHR